MTSKAVKHLTFVVAIVMLASVCAMAQAAQSQAPAPQNLTGTVTCEGRITQLYTCQRNQTQQTCTLDCVQRGSRFALLVGNQAYRLEGDSRELEIYAGGKATVTGIASIDRIEVLTASNAKHDMPGEANPLPSSMGGNTGKSQNGSQPQP